MVTYYTYKINQKGIYRSLEAVLGRRQGTAQDKGFGRGLLSKQ